MVSGFVTSPYEFSNISSGEARPMVIFVKLFLTFVSFLKAIYFYNLGMSVLIEFDAETKTAKLVQEYVKRLWYTWCRHRIALYNSLVSL